MQVTRSQSRKAQSAFEFLFLLLFVLFIATLVVVMLQQNLEREIDRLDRQVIQEFRNVWFSEIEEAATADGRYERDFSVEDAPRGFPVRVSFGADPENRSDEIVVGYKDLDFLFFLPAEVDYTGIGAETNLRDGVRIVRHCDTSCRVYLFNGSDTAAGKQNKALDTISAGVGSIEELKRHDDTLFAGGTGGFRVLNATDERGLTDTTDVGSGDANAASVHGGVAYLPVSNRVEMLNTSTNNVINDISTPPSPAHLVVDYPYGYVANENGDLGVYWLENLSSPLRIGSTTSSVTDADNAAYGRGAVYVAAGSSGLAVYDVRDRMRPEHNQTLGSGDVRRVLYHDETLIAVRDANIELYDVSDPLNPVSAATVSTGSGRVDADLLGNTLYVAKGGNGYEAWDVDFDDRSLTELYDNTGGTSNAVAPDVQAVYSGDGSDVRSLG